MYEPTLRDREWAREVLALIQDGGILAYPATGLVYRVSHAEHVLVLQSPPAGAAASETHTRTRAVFALLGYEVQDAQNENPRAHKWHLNAREGLILPFKISNLAFGNKIAPGAAPTFSAEVVQMPATVEQQEVVVSKKQTLADLEPAEKRELAQLEKEANGLLDSIGKSNLRLGEVLSKAQQILKTRGLFVEWLGKLRGLSTATAYRRIAEFQQAQEKLPKSVVEIASIAGINISGHTEARPFGQYTEAVEEVGLPPEEAVGSKAAATQWVKDVAHARVRQLQEARQQVMTVEVATSRAAADVVRLAKRLQPEEHPFFLVGVFEQVARELNLMSMQDAIRGMKPRKPHWTQTAEGKKKLSQPRATRTSAA